MIAQQIPVVIIAAMDSQRGIGRNNRMAWHLPEELAFFHRMTREPRRLHGGSSNHDNVVIMGRKTWESIPSAHLPMTGRLNIILSRDPHYTAHGATVAQSFEEAFQVAAQAEPSYIFIIGGGDVYAQAVQIPEVDGLILTSIAQDFNCDVFFPDIPERFQAEHWSLGSNLSGDVHFNIHAYATHDAAGIMPRIQRRMIS